MDNPKVPPELLAYYKKKLASIQGIEAEELANKGLKASRAAKKHKGKK
jgi:hypothetical protein